MKEIELLFHNCDLYLHACSNNKPDPDGSTSESEKDSSSHVSVSAKMSSWASINMARKSSLGDKKPQQFTWAIHNVPDFWGWLTLVSPLAQLCKWHFPTQNSYEMAVHEHNVDDRAIKYWPTAEKLNDLHCSLHNIYSGPKDDKSHAHSKTFWNKLVCAAYHIKHGVFPRAHNR